MEVAQEGPALNEGSEEAHGEAASPISISRNLRCASALKPAVAVMLGSAWAWAAEVVAPLSCSIRCASPPPREPATLHDG